MSKSRLAAVAVVVCIVAFGAPALQAAIITSVVTGNWNTASTWSPQQIPTSADDVIIQGGTGVSIPIGYAAVAKSVTLQGDIVSPNSLDLDAAGATLNVTNAVAFTAPGSSVLDQLIVGQGALASSGISIDAGVSGGISRLIVSSGSVTTGSITFTGTAANAEIKFTGSGSLDLTGDFGSGGTFVRSTSAVYFTGSGAQSVGSYSYFNLFINKSSGTATLAGPITVGINGTGGDLTINGGTLADNGNQITGNSNGAMTITGTGEIDLGNGAGSTLLPLFSSYSFTSTSTVAYKGQGSQSIEATPVYGNLIVDTGTGSASMSGNTTIVGNLTVNSGTLNLATFTHNVAGAWSNGGTINPGSSIVNFNSASTAQSISRGTSAFNSIQFSGAGAKSIVGNGLFVNKDVTINAGSNCNFGALLHQIGGNWTNNGTFSGTGSTIDFNGSSGSQSIGSSAFYNVTFSNASTKNASGALTVANNLVVNSGATFNPAAFTHNIGGNWTISGTFSPAASTINFNGSSTQTISATTFNNLTFSSSAGTKTFSGAINVNGSMTINSGASVNGGSGSNSILGNLTNDGTLTNVGNTWTFSGATAQTIGGVSGAQFANLTINNASGVTLTSSILVDTTLALGSSKITTGGNKVAINTGGSVTRSTGYVIGELQKKSATGTFTFDVGTAGGYSPVAMVITGTADMAVAAVAGNACCVFAGSNHLLHYWKIFPSGAVTANLTFTWPVGEVVGSESTYILGEYGTSWTYFTGAVDDSTHTAVLASASLPASLFSWSVGEAASLAGVPNITSFTPTSGPTTTAVTISGSAFTGASNVAFNGTSASFAVINDGQINTTVPAGATTGPVSVTTPGGTTSNGTFTLAGFPSIASFSPTAGSEGVTVVITGSAFTGATAVNFNGTPASFIVDNDNQITTTVPTGATSGTIAITSPSGTGISAASFTVNAPGLIQSAASGNWTSPSTWVGNIPPGTFDQVEILNTHTVTLTANASCAGLAVDSGSTLNIGTNTLTDSASGSFFGTVSGSGILMFSTNSGSTIDGNASIVPAVVFAGDRTIANTSTLSFNSGISINTGATVTNNGAVHVDNANGITGTGTFIQAAFATVTNGGPFLPTGTLLAATSPNLIDYNGAAQTVKAVIYDSLTLSGSGTKDITGLSTINGSLTLSGTASATATTGIGVGVDVTIGSGTTLGLGTFSHTVGGNWTNNGGSVSQGTSTVTFISSGSQTITRGTQGFASVQFSGVGPKSASGAGLFCTGNVTINSGSSFNGGTLAHQVTGNWVNNGTFNTGTSSVEFQGGTSSTIVGDFSTLIVNKSGAATVSLSGTVDVFSTTQMTAGTMTIGTQSLITGSITGSAAITMTTGKIFLTGNSNAWTGTFTPGTGTVEINGTGTQNIRGGTYNNVKINKATGTATMANALTVNGQLWIASGTLADNGFQMVAGGSATLQIDNAGTLKLGSVGTATSLPAFSSTSLSTSSTVTYGAGSSSQQIDSTPSYGHLVVDAAGVAGITKTLTGATLNAASLDVTTSGGGMTLDLQGKTANITGNIGGNGAISFGVSAGNLNIGGNFASTGTFTAGTSTVTFNGTGAQSIRNGTYNNLTIANSGTATLAGATIVNGAMQVSPGGSFSGGTSSLRTFGTATNSGTFNAGANTLDLRGDFSNNGAFTASTGTVAFNGTATQNWLGGFAATLNNVTVANSAGVNVNNSITVNGVFTLNGGNVTILGGQQIAITSGGSVSRSNGSYFIGKLQMFAPAATVTTFHLGTASGYAPVDVTPAQAGDINITSVSGAQPNATGTHLLSRYWTIGTATTTSVDMQFSYNVADMSGSELIYTAGRYSGATWNRPATTINTTTHTATVSGIAAYSGDWTVGEPLSLGGSAVCTPAPAGITSWWRAQGNAVDDVGTNNGTLNGGAITSGGKVGQAFSLNGSTGYVSAPDSASLHPANFSVEGWFFVSGGAGTTRMIASKPVGAGVEDSFIVYVASDNTIAAAVGDAVSTDILATTVTVSGGAWHHVAYTYDGTTQAVYLDGSLANAGTTAKTAGYDSGAFLIGADKDNGSFTNFFNGLIDEVTFYNSVLNASQIANIYGADSFGKCFSAPAPNVTGFTPSSGLTGSTVTITGTGFTGTSSVTFNGTPATYTVDSATQITATVPGGATTGPIAVTTAGGTFTTGGNFTVFTGTADLAVSVSAPGSATVGIAFNYTIGVTNLGPSAGGGVTVTSVIPANLTYNSVSTGAPWACGFSAPTLTCTATTLVTGAAPNISVNVTPISGASATESAGISASTTFDNNGANDSSSTVTTINPATADLAVTHSAAPASVGTGGTITYTVITTNNGPSTATTLTITDVLPPNVTFTGATGATCNNSAGTVTCSVASLLAGNNVTINITTTAGAVGTATASASATAAETDPNAADNTAVTATATITGSTVIVTNTNDSGAGSLRQALLDANGSVCTATCNVQFAIGSGAQTIALSSGLPSVSVPIVIDGATQPGYSGTPLISIDVFNDTGASPGLNLTGSNSTVRGLTILHAHNAGIVVGGSTGGNTIQSCVVKGNDTDGIRVTSANNTIGGATAPLGNVIFQNGDSGLVLFGPTASGNSVRHNFIGVDAGGATAFPNGIDGLQILDGASGNTIDLNVLSGNSNSGIYMTSSASPTQNNTVSGNLIGTDSSGGFAVPNGAAGIYVGCSAPLNTFGGTTVALRNVISGNPYGIRILGCGSDNNVIAGNYIGTGANGSTAISNGVGIALEGGAAQTMIGGTTTAAANIIANSAAAGVDIDTPAAGNGVLHNTITNNATTGINLDDLPLSTINDANDTDSGANNLQNAPVISGVSLNGSNLNVTLAVDSLGVAATQSLVVEVFKADGFGQGKQFLGTQCFNGNNISTTMTITGAPVAAGDPIVATATSYATACAAPTPTFSDGTSPFSAVVNAVCTPPVATITAPTSVCANSTGNTASVPFTSGATYNWTITNGSITNGQGTSSILFNANAGGSIALGVTATLGCSSTGSATVPIAPATATITAGGSTTFCNGGSVDLTASSGTSYQWFKDGNPVPVTSQTLTASVSGIYDVIVTNGSCSATSPTKTVVVNPNPSTTITGPSTVCPNAVFTLDAGAGFASYAWSNGATTQTITTLTSFSQTYSVVVTNAGGCSGGASHTVTVSGAPSATITAPGSVPANSTGLVASVAGGANSYAWTITNGTITAGQGTSSITFSIGSSTATLGVTVTTGSCTSTGSKTVTINNLADLSIAISGAPDPVPAGGTLTYTVVVKNNGPSFASNVTINTTLPAGAGFVNASGTGWTCFANATVQCSAQSSPVGTNSPVTITVNAPANAGAITATASVSAATPDPQNANNSASVTTTVGASNCPPPATLLSPANGAAGVTSPVSLQWSAVANATSYDVSISVDGNPGAITGSTSGTSLFINLPSGSITWFVVAHVPNCGDLTSATSQFTITPGANCGAHAAPTLMAPAQNATVTSPVTFSWQPVPEAIGYRLFVSVNGAADVDFGATDGATALTHDVASGSVTWVVDALFNGCPSTRSARGGFTVPQVDGCAGHGAPSLIAPANNATSVSSSIDFHWNAVDGASGYRVWIAVDGTAAAVAGETDATTLHSVISSGVVDWFVEALFDGCASTASAHFVFTVPHAESCGNATATPVSPANNSSTTTSIVTFVWNGVAGAGGYELYVSLDNGTPVLIGNTAGATSLTKEVGAGTLKWFVRALFDGCPPRDSQSFAFTYQPPAACANNVRPILAAPAEGALAVTSPVNFEWSDAGAASYKLFIVAPDGAQSGADLRDTTQQPRRNGLQLAAGAYEWYVEAAFNGCTSLRSTLSHFTVVTRPTCVVPAKPTILAPSEVSTGVAYKVRWLPALGADTYVVQEANNAAFTGATTFPPTNDNKLTFSHPNAGTFFYRVHGVSDCGNASGPNSAVVGVSILPQNSNDGATSPDTPVTLTYSIPLDAALAGQTFTATPTEPWLTVTPSSGTVPAGGLSLIVTANTAGLPLGTSLGGVTITTGTPASAKSASSGNTTSTTTLTVNVVQPVSPTSKSAPPPDALIIPAVAHADGFNAHFQSDIRLTNTSPQPMKYQLTFTPSGENGLANGKQTQLDVDPGRTVALDDVLKSWFSSGSTDGSTGTLEIRPLTTTAAKITSNAISGLANLVTFASSRTFNNATNGTYGQYIPAIPFANFIGKSAGTITLQQIAQSAKYRTNLGIVEGSGQPVSLLISIFGSNGQKIKEFPLDLKGGQHTQLNSFLTTQGLSLEDARVEVKVASGSGRVTAYASVLDNETSDPLLVTPTLLTSNGSTKYVIPGVADLNAWHSDVRIFNASSAKVDAELMFVSQTGSVQKVPLTLNPNEVRQLDNLLQSTFGVTNDGGALHISTSAASNLIATARTYNLTTSGTYGQFISAVTPNDAAALGTRPLQLLQIEESDRYRTNVGLAEVNGQPAKVEVTVVPPDSKVSAVVQLDLAANEFRQLNQILKQVGMENTYNARVSVQVISGTGKITAYASVIDQQTQDPTLLQAQ